MKSIVAAGLAAGAMAHTRSTFHDKEFQLKGKSAAAAQVTFTVGMPSSNSAVVESMLLDRSNPASPNYAQWLEMEQVAAMTATAPEIRAEVTAWMKAQGASCIDMNSALRCTASTDKIDSMFQTSMHEFDQIAADGSVKRTLHRVPVDKSLTLPAALDKKLLFVAGLYDFPTRRMRLGSGVRAIGAKPRAPRPVDAADLIVTTETVAAIYKSAGVTGSAAAITAPAEFQADQAILEADIKEFAKEMGLPAWTIAHKQGPFTGSDTEATLDGEYIAGVGQNNTQYWWTEADWMYEWTQHLAAAKNLSQVYSVSWGWSENDQCTVDQTGPCAGTKKSSAAYVEESNKGFASIGLAGVTIAISSGDSGAHGRTDGSCAKKETLPDWPTACPWILAIGATQLVDATKIAAPTSPYCKTPSQGDCAGAGTEVVASPATGALVASGGGFSNVAPQPTYQTAAVAAYLKSGALLPPAADFNATSRGYPDVAALGHNVLIYQQGQAEPVDGTSCSAPMWGGVLGMANAARLAAGKNVLGFVNPAIYKVAASTPAAFNDVTKGDNTCTEDGCKKGCTGFGAVAGWDATTGFGTPNIPVLIAALAAL